MIERKLTVAEIVLFGVSRIALGVGIGLLLSRRLGRRQRKAAGIALAVVGGATGVPFFVKAARHAREPRAGISAAA